MCCIQSTIMSLFALINFVYRYLLIGIVFSLSLFITVPFDGVIHYSISLTGNFLTLRVELYNRSSIYISFS